MSLSDSVGDFLTRVRNSQMSRKSCVVVPFSKMNEGILGILKEHGYIADFIRYHVKSKKGSKFSYFNVCLKYYNSLPVISQIFRISRPGQRRYVPANKVMKLYNGLGLMIVSTSKYGLISDDYARKMVVGGELICGVF